MFDCFQNFGVGKVFKDSNVLLCCEGDLVLIVSHACSKYSKCQSFQSFCECLKFFMYFKCVKSMSGCDNFESLGSFRNVGSVFNCPSKF